MTPQAILKRRNQKWNIKGKLPIPVEGWLTCPACNDSNWQFKEWYISHREEGAYRNDQAGEHRFPFRARVTFKCTSCSMYWLHGIPITESEARQFGWNGAGRVYKWREGEALLGT